MKLWKSRFFENLKSKLLSVLLDGMGQGSPKQYEYQPNGNTGPWELSKGKVYSRPKPSNHRSYNSTAGMTEWHGRSASKPMKGAKDGLEKE